MFLITDKPIDGNKLQLELSDDRAGAVCVFEGLVRNHNEGKPVNSLEYEAYNELAYTEAKKIIAEAEEKFTVYGIRCVHRVGHLKIGDTAVWVGVASAHRDAGFKACRYVIDEIKVRLPVWKKEHYVYETSEWVNCEQCAKHAHGNSEDLDQDDHCHSKVFQYTERQYYKKQYGLPGFGDVGQDKLRNAKVLVVGAGGLGCPALVSLAASGVGYIGVCDHDLVDISNLHRQTIYNVKQVGLKKAEIAADFIKKLNPFIKVQAITEMFDAENAKRWVSGYDLVLDCTDNFKTKFLIHDACWLNKIPLVQASVYQEEGQIQVFLARSEEPCLRCLWPVIPETGDLGNCAEVGILGVTPAIIGSLQANEAIKVLLDRGVLSGQTLLVDLATSEITKIKNHKSNMCPLCSNHAEINNIEVQNYMRGAGNSWELAFKNAEEIQSRNFKVIDLRPCIDIDDQSAWESSFIRVSGNEFSDFEQLGDQHKYLLVCSGGNKSRYLVNQLRQKGLENFYSLNQGLSSLNLEKPF